MDILLIVILILIFAVIILFSSPKLSPIPYFPSNYHDLGQILKSLKIKNNQTIIDLGAGDGIIIFTAAQYAKKHRLNTKFIALEINPILVFILHLRRFFSLNRHQIKIVWGDIFKLDYAQWKKKNPTFYIYISPWLISKLITKIKKGLPHFRLVSYMYPVKDLKLRSSLPGRHPTYYYWEC